MQITFEQFDDIIKYFYNKDNFANEFRNLLTKYDKLDFIDPYCFYDWKADDIIVKLLELIFSDSHHWISYYIYDLDCGRKWQEGMITTEDGIDICLGDTWHLWNFLKSER